MVHGLLIGLKIIGILIGAIILILFWILCMVLFVPVRYRVSGSYYDKIKGKVRFTWILHIVSMLIVYNENVSVSLRIFGVKVYPRKKKQKKEVKAAKEAVKEELQSEAEQSVEKISEVKRSVTEPVKPINSEEKKGEGSFFSKLNSYYDAMIKKVKRIKFQIEDTEAFFQDEENLALLRLLGKELKRMIRHILPVSGAGNIVFGFDDPYLTGQILSVISLCYGWYPKKLMITPVFDQAVLEAEGTFKGRIRASSLTFWFVRMYRKKRVKEWLRKLRNKGGKADGR